MHGPPPGPDNQPTPDETPTGPKIWRTGTLVYTSGGLALLFFWLLCGDFAWSMRDRSALPMAQWFLNNLKVPSWLFGLLLSSFPALIGLVLGPIVSFKSDRHRGRFGRRIPFLLVTTPIAAFGMVGLGVTPLISEWVHGHFPAQNEIVISVLCFGVFWTAFEFATIAGQAVFGGLINDVVPRQWIGRFFGLFRAVSLIDGIIFNKLIIGHAPEHYTVIFMAIGIFYGVAFMWVCLKVKEGDYPPPPPPATENSSLVHRFGAGTQTYFRECFSKSYYVLVFVALMTASLSFLPVNTFNIPYATSIGVSMTTYGNAMALTFSISLVLSYFLGWLADIFHPLRVSMAALAGYAVVTAWGSIYAVTVDAYLVALVLHGVLSGCYFTSAASMGQRLFPHSRFAQFSSAAGILASLGHIVLAPVVGAVIDHSGKVFRHTYTIGCGITIVAFVLMWMVYRRFCQLGGQENYIALE